MHVIVVTPRDREVFATELDQFFTERHRVYAEELKWVPEHRSGRERDQFDTLDATYLLVMDGDVLIGGSRMIPTHRPHMLSEVFPHTVTKGHLPRTRSAVEWTRGFIVKERREGSGLKLKAACCAAVMEYCLAMDYRRVGGIQDAKWLAIWRRMGWRVQDLGSAMDIGGEAWLPAYMDVSREALAAARHWAGVAGPLLQWRRTQIAIPGRPELTPRENEVLRSIVAGDTIKQSAMYLGISPRTVEAHRTRLRQKLAVDTTADLVRTALRG